MFVYAFFAVVGLSLAWWIGRSPVLRALIRGQGTDPGQFGSWQDHLDDIGTGPSWRSDGYGGRRETQIYSKHTRRH
jgi:hypothetical protein